MRNDCIISDEQITKLSKKSLKRLTPEQKQYVQAWDNFNHVNKEMTRFFTEAPRNLSGSVDWKQITETETERFQRLQKRSKNYLSIISELEASGIDKEPVMNLLRLVNSSEAELDALL